MPTTVQQVINGALAWSVANGGQSLVSDLPLLMRRIDIIQNSLFDRTSALNSDFHAVRATVTSTAGTLRSADLSAINPSTAPVRRVLRVLLPDNLRVSIVDARDIDAELAPRAILLGKTLSEAVAHDWGHDALALTLTVDYVKGPAPIAPSAEPTTTFVSIQDEYSDLIELELALWLAQRDVGRDTKDVDGLQKELARRMSDWEAYIQSFGGAAVTRFKHPTRRASP